MRSFHSPIRKFVIAYASAFLCLATSLPLDTKAQVAPVYDRGIMGLTQMLKRLNTSASAMMIGAHPDDEDTAMLAFLARGESARTAYLSLTRGDGGQNIIGPELGEALGVIRTEELLQARRLDGAEQYFTRAYDYGFSKTLAEAKTKWPEQIVMCDAVRAIREFRPLVVISQFSGTPADGHGQHQYAGYIAPLAVKAAADPSMCRDSGPAWKVQKFFVRSRAAADAQVRINTGRFDPVLGRSYFEIAMEARSQHKSQEQGVLELKGEMISALNLADGVPGTNGVFDGIDTSPGAIASHSGSSEQQFQRAAERIGVIAKRAYDEFDARRPGKIVPLLAEGYKLSRDAGLAAQEPHAKALAMSKMSQFLKALELASGIQIDALADRETLVAGEQFPVTVRVFLASPEIIAVTGLRLRNPDGWDVSEIETPAPRQQGFFRAESPAAARTFQVTVADNAVATEPYWLHEPRDGDLYRWPKADYVTHPVQPPEMTAEVRLQVAGTEVVFERPVEYRFADDTRGEVRRPLSVLPRVSVSVDPELIVVPVVKPALTREVSLAVTNNSPSELAAGARLYPRDPKSSITASDPGYVSFTKRGERSVIGTRVNIPANAGAGSHRLQAAATVGGKLAATYLASQRTLQYPHIQTHRIYTEAGTDLRIIDVEAAAVRVGYIPGSGDRIPDAVRELGIDLKVIGGQELSGGDLSVYDTIIVGIRAYQVNPDLVANNRRLTEFMNAGGKLIVQYQLSSYTQQNLPPYPAQQPSRTADENAAVNMVVPDHPLLNFPNKITPEDFNGWVQERNLYNFSTMDPKYVGLLETHDAGENENRGGLVVADVGKGKFVYCSYSLFRQLPAGVPGAYRLLANMISLPKAAVN